MSGGALRPGTRRRHERAEDGHDSGPRARAEPDRVGVRGMEARDHGRCRRSGRRRRLVSDDRQLARTGRTHERILQSLRTGRAPLQDVQPVRAERSGLDGCGGSLQRIRWSEPDQHSVADRSRSRKRGIAVEGRDEREPSWLSEPGARAACTTTRMSRSPRSPSGQRQRGTHRRGSAPGRSDPSPGRRRPMREPRLRACPLDSRPAPRRGARRRASACPPPRQPRRAEGRPTASRCATARSSRRPERTACSHPSRTRRRRARRAGLRRTRRGGAGGELSVVW